MEAKSTKQVEMLDDAKSILSKNQHLEMKLIVSRKIGTNEYDTRNNSDILPHWVLTYLRKLIRLTYLPFIKRDIYMTLLKKLIYPVKERHLK